MNIATRTAQALRSETVGGVLLLIGALIAVVWANSPWSDTYTGLLAVEIGPLDLRAWAGDGLLAVFFLVAGIELKHEFVVGELRDPRTALLPVVAAVCGVAVPSVIFFAITATDAQARQGWAVPAATDIAFALAVLAVLGRHLPAGMRSFLLTLAVVDDLIAITIIAIFYTDDLRVLPLLAGLAAVAAVGLLARRGWLRAWLGIPLAVAAWVGVHESGVHATVAGVLLGLALPAGTRVGHRLQPFSAGVAVPVFALCAAGVPFVGAGTPDALADPVFWAVVAGLVVGKPVGVVGGVLLTARLTGGARAPGPDLLGLGLLAGIGFTVSLLIGELAFGAGSVRDDHVRLGILVASGTAALLAAAVLVPRDRYHRDHRDVEGSAGSP